jgi:hypothetical protein
MTRVFLTTDTELSTSLHQRGVDPRDNFERTVMGKGADGRWGIEYQMDRLSAHGLKGVFFVEALCAEVLGLDMLKRVVDPILTRGHEVQLHVHTEWLEWFDKDPVAGRRGDNIHHFEEDQQRILLELGLEALQRAGAPRPVAYRAGNYGADNATLRALAKLGLRFDTSYNQPYIGGDCRIDVPAPLLGPTELEGLTEIPITFFEDYPGHTRPLQLCAVSSAELAWCLGDARLAARPTVVIVSHSFELLNARRTRSNKILLRRFDALCAAVKQTTTFAALAADKPPAATGAAVPKSNPARTAVRMVEQAVGALLYDRA